MPITVTRLTSDSDSTNAATQFNTASVTTEAGADTYLANVTASSTANPTITSPGDTWTLVTDGTNNADVDEVTLWRAPQGDGVINIAAPVQDGDLWYVIKVTGQDAGNPIVAVRTASGSGTAPSVTMPTPQAGSASLGVFAIEVATSHTPSGGFTKLDPEVTMGGPARTLMVQWNATASTTIAATAALTGAWDVIGVELRAAGGTSQNETGGSTATVTTVAAGGGSATEAATGGSAATVSTSTAGAGSATEAATGGSDATVATAATGAGAATEGVTDGSTATVTTQTTGEGSALEHASGGSQAIVTTLAAGGGSGSETEGDTGGSSVTVPTVVTGGGAAAEHAAGGSEATVTTAVTGGGSGTEEAGEPEPYRDITARRLPATHVAVRLAPTHTAARTQAIHTARRIPATHTARRLP